MALVNIQSTNTYDLTKSDRPYDDEEEAAEKQAVSFPINIYKRIKPVHGTLGYAFRNIKGRNDVVMEALKNLSRANNNRYKAIKEFIILWNNMDDYSRNRVDIFDWLCEKYDMNKARFFGVVQEGMFNFNDLMAQTAISGYTPEFVELVQRMTKKERNVRDRELFAKMAGLTKDSPLIGSIQDNSVKQELHVHTDSPIPSFTQAMRESDEGIRTIRQKPQRILTEGKQDYIDAEVTKDEREKELISVEEKTDERFKKIAMEI